MAHGLAVDFLGSFLARATMHCSSLRPSQVFVLFLPILCRFVRNHHCVPRRLTYSLLRQLATTLLGSLFFLGTRLSLCPSQEPTWPLPVPPSLRSFSPPLLRTPVPIFPSTRLPQLSILIRSLRAYSPSFLRTPVPIILSTRSPQPFLLICSLRSYSPPFRSYPCSVPRHSIPPSIRLVSHPLVTSHSRLPLSLR